MSLSNQELEVAGYHQVFDYTQYSHKNHVNVIPEKDFKRLVEDTFETITDTLRATYGPYASTVMISDQNETTTTKDGYNVFASMGFSHAYKQKVYHVLYKIISRVNKRVGDGTTSCILLAEKIFHELENITATTDEKMALFNVLNDIEKALQSAEIIEADKSEGLIQPLTKNSLDGLINLASNYDRDLTNVIVKALDPQVNENNEIEKVRNVVVESRIENDGDSTTNYDVDFLPGDYRVRVEMENEAALMFESPRKIRVALYDHAFGESDWNFFMHQYDKTTETIIVAREFNAMFRDTIWTKYCIQHRNVAMPHTIYLCRVRGNYFKNEIADLAAMLQTTPIGLHAQAVDHENLPVATISVHKGNCMCLYTDYVPEDHVKSLMQEMIDDDSDSMIKRSEYLNRINALSLTAKDTRVTVKSGTSLELKMISDKIDDCISIVNSALDFGVVPNMLMYGYNRINRLKTSDPLNEKVCDGIMKSIKGLFHDIWKSKHEDKFETKRDEITKEIYDGNAESFDIIKERFVPIEKLPTSAQYDIEVIVAAISIVKYLLTSRVFVFDAHLMRQVNDEGHYEPM